MVNIKNVNPKILITGVFVLLILGGILIFFVLKKSPVTSVGTTKPTTKPTTKATTKPIITPTQPIITPTQPIITPTQPIRPLTGREEVFLQILSGGMYIAPGKFQEVKESIFPNNPNITIATIQQIKEALAMGLETCDGGIVMDNNTEVFAFISPGAKSMNTNPACFTSQGVEVFKMPNITTPNIWVYGIKPVKGTSGVSRFSVEKWSLYDPLPPIITQAPIPTGPKEVYIQTLYEPIHIPPDKFQTIKRIYIPNNPNITLAKVQEIEFALNQGLKTCNTAMALNNGMEVLLTSCLGVNKIADASVGTFLSHIWVYGVKPPKGTVGISPFSIAKWSIHDT